MSTPYEYVPEQVTIQDGLPLAPAELKAFFQTTAENVFHL
jgi:2,3-dihydroxybenzoate decarboxylase